MRSVLMLKTAIIVFLLLAPVVHSAPGDRDSSRAEVSEDSGGVSFAFGLGVGNTEALKSTQGLLGTLVGVRFGGMRICLRVSPLLPVPINMEVMWHYDSLLFDSRGITSIGVICEYAGLRTGQFRWRLGLAVNHERAWHAYRYAEGKDYCYEADSYITFESLLGVNFTKFPRRTFWDSLVFKVGYRIPTNPDVPGMSWSDVAGPTWYLGLHWPKF